MRSVLMRSVLLLTGSLALLLTGCGAKAIPAPGAISSVIPSSTGVPNGLVPWGSFEFVSVQETGQIFTYNIASGAQILAGAPYKTPCNDPSGMVIATVGGSPVMAVVCYDTGSMLTLSVHADGSLTPLGSVAGLPRPYPGIALDGLDVLVPLFGTPNGTGGQVAKVSLATPSAPAVTGIVTLASPPGQTVNPGFLTYAAGLIFVCAGSESAPQDTSSTIQIIDEATMTLVGSPFVVAHSPQQLAVQGSVLYVTLYDVAQFESIDISNIASPKMLQIVSLATGQACHPIPVLVYGTAAYVGCYAEGWIARFDVTNPADMHPSTPIPGVDCPQLFKSSGPYLLVPGSSQGGSVYQINAGFGGPPISGRV